MKQLSVHCEQVLTLITFQERKMVPVNPNANREILSKKNKPKKIGLNNFFLFQST